MTESDLSFPIRPGFSYSSAIETRPFFTYQLSQRMITFFLVQYQTESVQEFRFALSEQIRQQIFYAIFLKKVETYVKSNVLYVPSESIQHQGDILHPAAAGLVQRGFLLPCAEDLQLFRKNCAEKQTPVCGRKSNQSLNPLPLWCARLCRNFAQGKTLSSSVTAGM